MAVINIIWTLICKEEIFIKLFYIKTNEICINLFTEFCSCWSINLFQNRNWVIRLIKLVNQSNNKENGVSNLFIWKNRFGKLLNIMTRKRLIKGIKRNLYTWFIVYYKSIVRKISGRKRNGAVHIYFFIGLCHW